MTVKDEAVNWFEEVFRFLGTNLEKSNVTYKRPESGQRDSWVIKKRVGGKTLVLEIHAKIDEHIEL